MGKVTKPKYEEILDAMLESIAEHVESLPEDKRKRVIKAIRAYSFDAAQQPSKTQPPTNGNARCRERSEPR
jgi:hypothetical protein